ncbi:flavonol synthase/flavanone 3-hydroxylase-like isoform X2 [Magnolia sinica]|uniref:flavonol synthase/flavanone 3-hydroxylase-like isoform X2 n=1 Tax=Magnolia sinica TaxID=86752 RepID=UPI00265968F0|nr:flavonol synthase/flavanone 3-hydroxylase-like isoform X2 [Magnolia sinica]
MEVERVQSIASTHLSKDNIPTEFIRLENEQPGTTTFYGPIPEIPIVDLSDKDHNRVVREIAKASEEFGIFRVVNHGIPTDVIEKLQSVGKAFFQLPEEEKEKYAIKPGSEKLEGYGTKLQKESEGKKAWVDFFFHNVWPPSSVNYDAWPRNPNYKEANEEYAKHVMVVVDTILANLSLGLGLEGGVLKDAVGGADLEYLLKINYYPPCPRPDLALGVVAHTDMSAVTILVPNDVSGLQVFKDDIWFNVEYIPNALIVHIGDQIEKVACGEKNGSVLKARLKTVLAFSSKQESNRYCYLTVNQPLKS